MSVFVDTSALYAVLDADDRNHEGAKQAWADLLGMDEALVCTNYVLVETFALVQHRLGMEAVRALANEVLPVLRTLWATSNFTKQTLLPKDSKSSRKE